MTRQQRLVVLSFVFALLVIAVGYSLLPFTFADTIHCSPPLLGAEPKEKAAPSAASSARSRTACRPARAGPSSRR